MVLKKKSFGETGEITEDSIRKAIAEGLHFLGRFIRAFIELLTGIIRPISLVIGITIMICLAAIWIAALFGIVFGFPFLNFLFPDIPFLTAIGITNTLIVIGVPLVSVIFFISRTLFGTRISKPWMTGVWGFWLLNLVSIAIIFGVILQDFKVGREVSRDLSLDDLTSDTLAVQFTANPYEDVLLQLGDRFEVTEGQLVNENIYLLIEKAESDNFEISERRYSRGEKIEDALTNAGNIDYKSSINGNTLTLPSFFILSENLKWRNQTVFITIKVPEGKYVLLGEKSSDFLRSVDFKDGFGYADMEESESRVWVMTAEGLALPGVERSSEETNESQFGNFNNLRLSGPMKIYIEKSDRYSVRLSGRDAFVQKVEKSQQLEELTISAGFERSNAPVRLYIHMPALHSVILEETDDVKITGFDQEEMVIDCAGSQEIKANVEVTSLTANLKGESELDIRGSGSQFFIQMEGKSEIDAERYTVTTARLTAPGDHRIKLSVTDTLFRNIKEGATVKLTGEPVIINE